MALAKFDKREYAKRYREKNRDKLVAACRAYYTQNRERLAAYQRERRKNEPELFKERERLRYLKHKAKRNASNRRNYEANREHYLKLGKIAYHRTKDAYNEQRRQDRKINPDKYRRRSLNRYWSDPDKSRASNLLNYGKHAAKRREYTRSRRRNWTPEEWAKQYESAARWRKQNRGKHRDYDKARRSKMKMAESDRAAIAALYLRARTAKVIVCVYCRKLIPKGLRQVDHVIALAMGGLHHPSNMVIACKRCNCRKHTRDVKQFLADMSA
jgi:5-methylcytosine-specific restriction endonuclease McrA